MKATCKGCGMEIDAEFWDKEPLCEGCSEGADMESYLNRYWEMLRSELETDLD